MPKQPTLTASEYRALYARNPPPQPSKPSGAKKGRPNLNEVLKSLVIASKHTIHEQEVKIKPLSVNSCWQGHRYKTKEYKKYEKLALSMLQDKAIPLPPCRLEITFYMSNMASDVDNPVKPWIDILQKKFGFNDRDIFELNLKKIKVKKGEEKIFYCLTGI